MLLGDKHCDIRIAAADWTTSRFKARFDSRAAPIKCPAEWALNQKPKPAAEPR